MVLSSSDRILAKLHLVHLLQTPVELLNNIKNLSSALPMSEVAEENRQHLVKSTVDIYNENIALQSDVWFPEGSTSKHTLHCSFFWQHLIKHSSRTGTSRHEPALHQSNFLDFAARSWPHSTMSFLSLIRVDALQRIY